MIKLDSKNIIYYKYKDTKQLDLELILLHQGVSFNISTNYTSFFNTNWLKLQRQNTYFYILFNLLLLLSFNIFDKMGFSRYSICQSSYVRRSSVTTLSRGPMARKKWSRNQFLTKENKFRVKYSISNTGQIIKNDTRLFNQSSTLSKTLTERLLLCKLTALNKLFSRFTGSDIFLIEYMTKNILPLETNLLQLKNTDISLIVNSDFSVFKFN